MAPVELQSKLQALRGRLRACFLLDGASRSAAVFVAVVTASVFFDWLARLREDLPSEVRLTLLLGGMGLFGYVVWRYLLAPLGLRLTADDLAIAVERARPELRDRLISTVQLSREGLLPEFGASRELVGALASETVAATSGMRFEEVARLGALRRQLLAGAAAVAFALVMCGAAGNWVKPGLLRYFAPFGSVRWPATTELELVGPPAIVARGEAVELAARQVRGAQTRGEICYRPAGERDWTTETLLAGEDGALRREFPAVSGDLEYFFRAYDGFCGTRSEPHRLVVTDRPAVESVSLHYAFPAYTGLAPTDGEPGAAEARALVGTEVTALVRFNRKVDRATLTAPAAGGADARETFGIALAPDGLSGEGRFTIRRAGSYEISAVSVVRAGRADGSEAVRELECLRPAAYPIKAPPDEAPRVRIEQPGADRDVAPEARVELLAEARDDFGVAAADLRYEIGDRPGPVGVSLRPDSGALPARVAGFSHRWDLAGLKLVPGDVVSYRVEARDACTIPGPNTGRSDTFRLRVVSRNDMIAILAQEESAIRRELENISERQTTDKARVDDIRARPAFENSDRLGAAAAETEQRGIARSTGELRARTEALRDRMNANGLATPEKDAQYGALAMALGGMEKQKMPDAAEAIRAGRTAGSDDERRAGLSQASGRQREILDELNGLLGRMKRSELTDDLARLARELLRKQRELAGESTAFARSGRLGNARAPGELKDEAVRTALAALAVRQAGAAGDMDDLERRMVEALAALRAGDAFAAAKVGDALAIAQDADFAATADGRTPPPTAERQSVAKVMTAAAEALGRLQMGRATGEQERGVQALERIVACLERRKRTDFDDLVGKLKGLEAGFAEAATRQHGHAARTAKLEDGSRDGSGESAAPSTDGQASDPSGGKRRKELAAIADDQARTRELTDKLRKLSDELARETGEQGLEDASDHAGKAGNSQRQAEGQLGQGRAGRAGESQEEAGDELEKARQAVADARDRIQRRQQEEKLFQIEQELKEVLAVQLGVNGTTTDVEKARVGNELTREQAAAILEAARQETVIFGRVRSAIRLLDESPVFSWVLDEASGDMREVRDRLDRQDTGGVTRDVEKDVVAKIEQLIAALQKERASRAEDKRNPPPGPPPGGGPPGGKPPLVPPLAELKMIRWMQEDVNGKTRRVDDQVRKADGAKLTEELRALLERAAQKQGDVARITGELADLLEKSERQAHH